MKFPFGKCPICHRYSLRVKAHMKHKHFRIGLSEEETRKEYEKLLEELKQ